LILSSTGTEENPQSCGITPTCLAFCPKRAECMCQWLAQPETIEQFKTHTVRIVRMD
jgi:hypothetical protein